MRVVTTLPQNHLGLVPDALQSIEADGYDGVVALENRHDPFLPLAVAAVHSERIELATAIALSFTRSPMTLAHMCWDLQQASGGRFVLGLGSQVKGHNVRRFSVPWTPPAPRMREVIESLRAIWRSWSTGERLNYEGDHYQFSLMTPNFTPEPLQGCAPPPITIAAVGPAMMRLAAAHCDGVRLHAFCTRKYVEDVVLPRLAEGRRPSSVARESFQISGGGFIATGPDEESVAEKLEWVRYRVGFYGSTRAYWPVLKAHGLEELGERLHWMSRNDGWDQMAGAVADDVVRLFAAVGRHDEIARRIEERFGGIADVVSASASPELPSDLPPELIQDIQRIPSAFEGFESPLTR